LNGELREVSVQDVYKGDIVLVREGERIPVDGVVISGLASVDTSSMTGESALQEKGIGDNVLGITVVVEGHIRIQATSVGENSTVSRMIKIVESAEKNKSKTHLMADRFAQFFLPLVLLGGVGIYVFTQNMTMVIAYFLVACADDIAVSIPLAFSAALGQAARNGIIIKGGKWLEALARVKTFVLDKTGTLTYGSFSIWETHIEPGVDQIVFWRSVAGVERYSSHPVGKAVYREAKKKYGKEIPEAQDITIHDGAGIIGNVSGVRVAVGDEDIAKVSGLEMEDWVHQKFLKEKEQHEKTTLLVFLDGVFSGLITIADTPKEGARESIQDLRNEGIEHIVMLTGDTERTARDIAEKLSITEFRYGLRPEDKVSEVGKYLKDGDVAMVGDGVNDAPVLARSSVGIAMGIRGTAIAIESADVVLLEDDLERLSYLVRLGRKTLSVVRWNIIIWVVTNLLGFALVLFGVLDPALAALYNFLTDFLPLINSARLFVKRVD
jgi:heavy metal translocating P-type ATPase